jgi:hypothetical protein
LRLRFGRLPPVKITKKAKDLKFCLGDIR